MSSQNLLFTKLQQWTIVTEKNLTKTVIQICIFQSEAHSEAPTKSLDELLVGPNIKLGFVTELFK